MERRFYSKVAPIYSTYNGVVKHLIADIEVKYQKFPLPILNEIRAFNDHLARCFFPDAGLNDIDKETQLAEGHMRRIVLDCYKFLNVYLHKNVKRKFESYTRWVDLSSIEDGKFLNKYSILCSEIETKWRDAKKIESKDKEKSLELHQDVYNLFYDLDELITENRWKILRAKAKYYSNWIWKFILFLLTAIISGFLSSGIIDYKAIWETIVQYFTK